LFRGSTLIPQLGSTAKLFLVHHQERADFVALALRIFFYNKESKGFFYKYENNY